MVIFVASFHFILGPDISTFSTGELFLYRLTEQELRKAAKKLSDDLSFSYQNETWMKEAMV